MRTARWRLPCWHWIPKPHGSCQSCCSLPELLWEAELLSPESAWDELVLWEELAVPLEAEAEPAGEAVLSLLEEL